MPARSFVLIVTIFKKYYLLIESHHDEREIKQNECPYLNCLHCQEMQYLFMTYRVPDDRTFENKSAENAACSESKLGFFDFE